MHAYYHLTLFRMGIVGAANGWGVQKGPHLYPKMMKLSTVIP